jgi:carboxymethylenebutenolidase
MPPIRRHPQSPPRAVSMPDGSAPHPGVVIGAEAYGVNPFIHGVQQRLNRLGYAAAVPDYYHGQGPRDVEAYDDFTEVVEHIGRLDFTCGARDLAEAVDTMRATPRGPLRHDEADRAAWDDAVAFLRAHTEG